MAFIGTSGWQYLPFRERFYPTELPNAELLSFYSRHLKTVEVNSTFYHFSRVMTYQNWCNATPPDFKIVLKANRYFTHESRLTDPEAKMSEFLERARTIGPRLGPILFQLPPSLKYDARLLIQFVTALPSDLHFAMEFRNPSWHTPRTLKILENHGVAWCIHDLRGHLSPLEVTSELVYVRLHGPLAQPYRGTYHPEALAEWAERVRTWESEGREVFVFFDNTMFGDAIDNALELQTLVGKSRRRRKAG